MDQNTYQDQRLINIETELGIKFGIENNSKRLQAHGSEINSLLSRFEALENRIKTLEQARQTQITLNTRFMKLEDFVAKKEAEKPIVSRIVESPKKSWWDRFIK